MKRKFAIPFVAAICAACSSPTPDTPATRAETVKKVLEKVETTPEGTSTATTFEAYKQELARRISEVNSTNIYLDRPQALLRSVIVIKYSVDRNGKLMHSEIVRSNRDKTTEATALSTLKKTAPFPMPAPHLLHNGRVEISETWLFNNDGRFQLRTIARPQMSE
jgi:periplasmic protein TonB